MILLFLASQVCLMALLILIFTGISCRRNDSRRLNYFQRFCNALWHRIAYGKKIRHQIFNEHPRGYKKILPNAELRNQFEVIHKCMDYLIWLFTPQTQTSSTDISNRWIIFRYYCCHLVTARENKQGGRMRATAQLFCYVLVSLTIKRLLFYTASKMDIICMLYYAITLSALIGLCVHHRPYKLHNRRQKQIYTGIKHCTSNTLWKK